MLKKHFIFLFFLCLVLSFLYSETVFTFEPLGSNERLAYQYRNAELTLFAQDVQSLYITRRIGSWRAVGRRSAFRAFEFTNNRRVVFFEVYVETQIEPELRNGESVRELVTTLHHLSGDKGTVKRVFEDMLSPSFALSADGRQMLITDTFAGAVPPWGRQSEAMFFLYCTETWERLHEFSWVFRAAVGIASPHRNSDGAFTITYAGGTPIGGGGSMVLGVFALATFDPAILELKVLWDRTDWSREEWQQADDFQRVPRMQDFFDDRGDHQFDRTLHLERVIFMSQPQDTTSVENIVLVLTDIEQSDNKNKFFFIILGVAGLLFFCIVLIFLKKKKNV